MELDKLKEMLIDHEGLVLTPYKDTVGVETIGVGHNMKARPLSLEMQHTLSRTGAITEDQAMELLEADIDIVVEELNKFEWFGGLSDARQNALIDIVFNLGLSRFMGFKNLIAAIETEDFDTAEKEMLDSLWARQVGRRSLDLAQMIKNG
jgi:lysozyme